MRTGLLAVGLSLLPLAEGFAPPCTTTAPSSHRFCSADRPAQPDAAVSSLSGRNRRRLSQLYSIRTGKARQDDDGMGYDEKRVVDPDASLTPEEWLKKYGEEVDTSVLYDEKVGR